MCIRRTEWEGANICKIKRYETKSIWIVLFISYYLFVVVWKRTIVSLRQFQLPIYFHHFSIHLLFIVKIHLDYIYKATNTGTDKKALILYEIPFKVKAAQILW